MESETILMIWDIGRVVLHVILHERYRSLQQKIA